ncbi:unnamed protein product [Cylicostephanus goldi]|uniref:Uncharacterized protein n=1 Tax=Cylicostephanus goldi TaxID=71465 RepID=A0A3P7P0X8_CYLGO|nr:unnamed protein product [Cylicostephanus goldi]
MKCSLALFIIATLCTLLTALNSKVNNRDVLWGPPPYIPPFKPLQPNRPQKHQNMPYDPSAPKVQRPHHGPYPQPQPPQGHQQIKQSQGSAFQAVRRGGSRPGSPSHQGGSFNQRGGSRPGSP